MHHSPPELYVCSLALLLALPACGGDDARGGPAGTGIGSSIGSTSQMGETSGTTGDDSATTSATKPTTGNDTDPGTQGTASPPTTGAPNFDLGGVGTVTGEPMPGCQAVDFLFVIDNSVSMDNEQEALVGAFPGFMDAITGTLEAGSDYHIMVLDTDAWGRCDTANPWDGQSPAHGTCNDYIEQTVFAECDGLRGAGVVHPAGEDASNMLCMPSSGKRYIDGTEPNLPAMFGCMATVGTAGHSQERPMNAIEAALDPNDAPVQACNDGFLRDEALLVITFVSDDPGSPDEREPLDWYNAVLAAKAGDPTGVVVLGLGPGGPGCGGGGDHWLEFVEMWGENGIHGPVCGTAEEYVQFFADAVSTIDQACEDFQPPG